MQTRRARDQDLESLMETFVTLPESTSTQDELVFELTDTLIAVLHQELHQNRRLLRVIHQKKAILAAGDQFELEPILRNQKAILADCVTYERERNAILLALSGHIHGDGAKPMRLAELIGFSDPEVRDELLELREEMRDLADELEALTGVACRFARHISGNMRLYMRDVDIDDADSGESSDGWTTEATSLLGHEDEA